MSFIIRSVYDKDDMVAFQKVMGMYIERLRCTAMRLIYLVMTLAFAYMTVLSFLQGRASTAVICILVTLCVFYLMMQYDIIQGGNRWTRWKRQNGTAEMYYVFDEDGIGTDGSERRVPYTVGYACYETSGHYFLFMTKQNCYMIKKTDFAEGTPELFAPFIASKIGKQITQVPTSKKK